MVSLASVRGGAVPGDTEAPTVDVLALLTGCLFALTTSSAQAHSGSYDMKYVDGSNLVLLTFNTHQPVSGLDIVHNIRLYDLVGAPIPYDEVHVEVRTRSNTERVSPGGSSTISQATLPMLPTNESKETYADPVRPPAMVPPPPGSPGAGLVAAGLADAQRSS